MRKRGGDVDTGILGYSVLKPRCCETVMSLLFIIMYKYTDSWKMTEQRHNVHISSPRMVVARTTGRLTITL